MLTQKFVAAQTCAGAFDSVPLADGAIRRLLAAGFSKDELAVICPATLKDHFLAEAPHAEVPAATATHALAMGGALGATLGGLALVATVLTGGVLGPVTAAVYITGGAIAGGFSDLIISKGYELEVADHYKRAIAQGQIVVGVELGEDGTGRLAEAQRILDEAGAKTLASA